MKTALIDGKQIPKFDKNIIGNLLLNEATPDIVREEKMIVGIRNEAGEIYRISFQATTPCTCASRARGLFAINLDLQLGLSH